MRKIFEGSKSSNFIFCLEHRVFGKENEKEWPGTVFHFVTISSQILLELLFYSFLISGKFLHSLIQFFFNTRITHLSFLLSFISYFVLPFQTFFLHTFPYQWERVVPSSCLSKYIVTTRCNTEDTSLLSTLCWYFSHLLLIQFCVMFFVLKRRIHFTDFPFHSFLSSSCKWMSDLSSNPISFSLGKNPLNLHCSFEG